MTTQERTRNDRLRELAGTARPCITLALRGDGAGGGTIEAKDAVAAARKKLEDRGADSAGLMKPVMEALATYAAETRGRGGLVILRSPAVMETHRISGIGPLLRVDDRFDLRTVLSVLAAATERFFILALSQKHARILKCTEDGTAEIPFPAGFATSLAEAIPMRQPDHVLDNRAAAGPSIGTGAVMFGTSSSQDDKNEYLAHYFKELDRAVKAVLKGEDAPLVPAGVEHELALYRRVNTYANLLEPGIHGAPDGLEDSEMRRRALDLLRREDPNQQMPADYDKRVGAGRASSHIHEIVTAAYQGRISHLFFQANSEYRGTYDPVRQRVKRSDDPGDEPVDLIETAAWETIARGGEVALLPGAAMPGGVPVCALFRYAAPQAAARTESAPARG